VVALTGPSGSGKTTTAMRLQEYLQNLGVKVCLLSMDNFFLPLDKRPPEATDWESPYCVDVDTLLTLHLPAAGRHGRPTFPGTTSKMARHRRL
jgi:uridine kinase